MNKYKDIISKKNISMTFLLFVFFLNSIQLNSQPLTVEQTIEYLNNLSKENPSSPFTVSNCTAQHHKTYQLKEDGTLVIKEYRKLFDCKNSITNTTKLTIAKYINISDIDVDKIKIDDVISWLVIPCKKGDCVINEIPSQYSGRNDPRDEIRLSERTTYVAEKLQNAMIYLVNTALESAKYSRNDNDDPFTPQNFKDPRYKVSSDNAKTQIQLGDEQGVKTLLVSFGSGKVKRRFILDSGAGELSISRGLEQDLIQSGLIKRENYLSPGLYQLADGSIITERRILIPKITVGTFTVYNVAASVGNYNNPLLLGQSFLMKFRQWSIDNNSNKLILEK